MTTAPADPMIGRLIDGRYQVRSRIARGGMATVYLATDLRLERRVAIKIMHGHLADDNSFKTRFVQEARSAARLAHPNVVNVFDQGQDDDMAYLVMEYLPGITLRDLLKDYKKLTPEQTVDIMDAVLSGLAAAHKAGIVHRDLKPENVLLADDGRIKLGDFGLARAASANTATGQALLGTIAYLSPELVTRGVADARSDIYAVGIMMFEMLTGEQPYVGEAPMQIAYQHANDSVPMPSTKNPSVPAELDELVLWATSRDPDARPHDARDLLDRLREHEPAIRAPQPFGVTRATVVMPNATDPTAETRILNPPPLVPAAAASAADVGSEVATLTRGADRRRRTGYWLFALVLLLTGLAAGTGWYFGAGPGAFAVVPATANLEPAAASAQLHRAGFAVAAAEENSATIQKGRVIGTRPAAGSHARNGTRVTMIVSLGPRILDVPGVAGKTEADARALLKDFTVAAQNATQFSADVAAGSVVAIVDPNGNAVPATYPERGPITLVVSLGAVPNVVGLSTADAQSKLEQAKLKPVLGDPQYSDTVQSGVIISQKTTTDPVHQNDTITLVASKGPQPVVVPDVTGKTWADAKKALEAAGLKPQYNPGADIAPFPTFLTVAGTDPAAGATVPKGSTIKVSFNGF